MFLEKSKWVNTITTIKIRHKIILLNVIILIIPIIFFTLVATQYYQQLQIQKQIDYVDNELDETYEQFMNSMEICNMTVQTMLLNRGIEKFIEDITDGKIISVHRLIEFNQTEITAVERLVNTNPYINSVRIYIDDEFLELAPAIYKASRYKRPHIIKKVEPNQWYFGEKDNISPMQKWATYQEPLAAVVSPYTDIRREQIGIIEVTTPMKQMFPPMYETTEDDVMYFIDKAGRMYCDDYTEVLKWKSYEKDIRKVPLQEENIEVITLGHEKVVAGYRHIKQIDGYLIKVRSLRKVEEEINILRIMVGISVICLIGIITLLINKSTQIVFKNFYKVLDKIQEIQKGNLNVEIEDFGKGEVGELGRNIQTMARNIQELMKDKITQETLMKDSEIKALQNQINAHFIYNVLESIKMMAEIEGMFDISDAITFLGKLLRYSMKWKSPKVKVKEELEYIENYISLLNLRYEYEISLNISISEDILEQDIPKMCIQPIVENALKHGIEEVAEDTTLYIKGKRHGDYFIIEVTDFGLGMNKEQVEKLRMRIRGEIGEERQSSNGIGLKNVQDRIQICFGMAYGLEVASKEKCFTKILMKLPFKS